MNWNKASLQWTLGVLSLSSEIPQVLRGIFAKSCQPVYPDRRPEASLIESIERRELAPVLLFGLRYVCVPQAVQMTIQRSSTHPRRFLSQVA